MKERVSFRMPEEVLSLVDGYAVATKTNRSQALLELVLRGLAVEHDALYSSELSRIVTSNMRAELESFRLRLLDALDVYAEAGQASSDRAAAAAYASLLAAMDAARPEEPEEACAVYESAGAAMAYGAGRAEAIEAANRSIASQARRAIESMLWE